MSDKLFCPVCINTDLQHPIWTACKLFKCAACGCKVSPAELPCDEPACPLREAA